MSATSGVVAGPGVSRRSVLLAAATGAGLVACGKSPDSDAGSSGTISAEATRAIVQDAYIFGYPLVLMDVTRVAALEHTPINTFAHATTLPTSASRELVRMNLDTLYSTAWLDVSDEPVVLQVPPMDGDRYWLMQVLDAWTNTVHNPSSVRPQVQPGAPAPPFTYAITGPGWSGRLPDGMAQLAVPTPTIWLVGRIQVNGDADLPAVRAVQQGLKLNRLSAWIAGREPEPVAPNPVPATPVPPPQQVIEMDDTAFFNRLCAAMAVNPPAPADQPALERFATIGIRPGGELSGVSSVDLAAAVAEAKKEIPAAADPNMVNQNGWTFDPALGAYGTNYPLRAGVAWKGLSANLPEDAVYPSIFGNADLNGSPANFRLRFPPGQLPPVDAFWSLTAYGADNYLVPNPAGIYAIGHLIPVVPDADGSVELAIQSADPGPAVPVGNWLPIPAAGQFSLTMRLYAPKDVAIDGRWQPPVLTVAS